MSVAIHIPDKRAHRAAPDAGPRGRGVQPDAAPVAGLALFAPASPQLYRVNLGGSEGPPYRPRPGGSGDFW